MAAATLPPVQAPPLETPPGMPARKRFTRQEVERMDAAGVFEGQRYELIDGDLIDKMGQKPPHASGVRRIQIALRKIVNPDLIQAQLPIDVSESDREYTEPEPDVAVFAEWKPEFDTRHPRGDELLLLVEVSDTTAAFDLTRKAVLYAKAGVREYWVLDVGRRKLIVHRQPEGSIYRVTLVLNESDVLSLDGRLEILKVADLLPAA